MNKDSSDEFYKRLKEELLKTSSWPSDYLYKFIVPTDPEKIKAIEGIFDNTGAVIESRKSSKGKYTSLSVTVHLADPDAVIRYYREVAKVEGVISL
jgi:putative lipoic acid-binding regulatory protein